jgi:hypothetical protein
MEMEIKTGNAVVEVGEVQTGRGVMVMCFKCGVVSGTVVRNTPHSNVPWKKLSL